MKDFRFNDLSDCLVMVQKANQQPRYELNKQAISRTYDDVLPERKTNLLRANSSSSEEEDSAVDDINNNLSPGEMLGSEDFLVNNYNNNIFKEFLKTTVLSPSEELEKTTLPDILPKNLTEDKDAVKGISAFNDTIGDTGSVLLSKRKEGQINMAKEKSSNRIPSFVTELNTVKSHKHLPKNMTKEYQKKLQSVCATEERSNTLFNPRNKSTYSSRMISTPKNNIQSPKAPLTRPKKPNQTSNAVSHRRLSKELESTPKEDLLKPSLLKDPSRRSVQQKDRPRERDENCNNNRQTTVRRKLSVTHPAIRSTVLNCDYSYNGKDVSSPELFEVFTMETAVPTVDWSAMENSLTRISKESKWNRRRQTDREEIRKKLAMESDSEECTNAGPKLEIQECTNLQICFMNDTFSDHDGPASDQDADIKVDFKEKVFEENLSSSTPEKVLNTKKKELNFFSNKNNQCFVIKRQRPLFFFSRPKSLQLNSILKISKEKSKQEKKEDIVTRHARLYTEARVALAQAKDMARMQMEIEKQKKKSPISEIVGIILPNGNKFGKRFLTDMNVAQLQVIVNDLHTQIENLNEELMRLLLERDDLHMEQDSKLVDIEDFTRYLGLKIPDSSKCSSENSHGHKRNQKLNGAKHHNVLKVKNIHVS